LLTYHRRTGNYTSLSGNFRIVDHTDTTHP
jgi:hypothetical protein